MRLIAHIRNAVALAPRAFRVRVWQITSWGQGPRTERALPEGIDVGYPLCDRALLMQRGEAIVTGPPGEVIKQYKALVANEAAPPFSGIGPLREWREREDAPGDRVVRLRAVRVCGEDGVTLSSVDIRHPVGIEITYDVLEGGHVLVPTAHFSTRRGCICLACWISNRSGSGDRSQPDGT